MFGFLKPRKPKSMHFQLGKGADTLIAASRQKFDPALVMQGTADITTTASLAKEYFGLQVQRGSKFDEFFIAMGGDDRRKMAALIRYFGAELERISTYEERGKLVASWFES